MKSSRTCGRRFCIDNEFGQESDHGIVIPESLANVYMTILANCIADSCGVSLISDETQINNFSLFVRRSEPGALERHVSILETELPIVLPENLWGSTYYLS